MGDGITKLPSVHYNYYPGGHTMKYWGPITNFEVTP